MVPERDPLARGFPRAPEPFGLTANRGSYVPREATERALAELTAAVRGAVPVTLARFIGAAEIVGALGLLLPALTRIRPSLTPMAAGGLATIMVLATVVHLVRGEMSLVPVNLVLGGLAVFVWWGRTQKAPILPKT